MVCSLLNFYQSHNSLCRPIDFLKNSDVSSQYILAPKSMLPLHSNTNEGTKGAVESRGIRFKN